MIRRAFVLDLETDGKTFCAVDRATAEDLTGAVRRRQCFGSRGVVDRPRRSGADARCAPRIAILCRSGSVPGAAFVRAVVWTLCATRVAPRPRIRRNRSADGCPGRGLRAACACLLFSCDSRAAAHARRDGKSGFCADNRRVCAPNIVVDRCPATPPMPVAAPAPRQPTESRPRHAAIFCPRTRARARRRPLSSRVIDFGDRDGGVSPEDASGAAGRGWHGAAAARGGRQTRPLSGILAFRGVWGGGAPLRLVFRLWAGAVVIT